MSSTHLLVALNADHTKISWSGNARYLSYLIRGDLTWQKVATTFEQLTRAQKLREDSARTLMAILRLA